MINQHLLQGIEMILRRSVQLQRGEVVEVDRPKRGGEVDPLSGRQTILPADPNHGREGPVWQTQEEGQPVKVWFEDGIRPYSPDNLVPVGRSVPMDHLPEIYPKETA